MIKIPYLINVLDAIGIPKRTFMIDYHKDGNYFNDCTHITGICSDKFAIDTILKDFDEQGKIVYSIFELLEGFTSSEIKALMAQNFQEACKYVQPLYYDINRELYNYKG